jgi:hypothetical protein
VMLRAMAPKIRPWKGLSVHQYSCPDSPRG